MRSLSLVAPIVILVSLSLSQVNSLPLITEQDMEGIKGSRGTILLHIPRRFEDSSHKKTSTTQRNINHYQQAHETTLEKALSREKALLNGQHVKKSSGKSVLNSPFIDWWITRTQ
ncbi:hypothetical protein C0J52_19476 [Blattella germanica]|nr:hypothetical protein C0J52_19476 [Blattella germanica]